MELCLTVRFSTYDDDDDDDDDGDDDDGDDDDGDDDDDDDDDDDGDDGDDDDGDDGDDVGLCCWKPDDMLYAMRTLFNVFYIFYIS